VPARLNRKNRWSRRRFTIPLLRRVPPALRDPLRALYTPVWIFPVVLAVWLLLGYWPSRAYEPLDQAGVFGDSFGYINSLFSGMALAGVIVAIFLQRQELKLQREELLETRRELSKSAEAHQQSQQALFLAAYLNAFGALRESHADLIDSEKNLVFQPSKAIHEDMLLYLHAILDQLEPYVRRLFPIPSISACVRQRVVSLGSHLRGFVEVRASLRNIKQAERAFHECAAQIRMLAEHLSGLDDAALARQLIDLAGELDSVGRRARTGPESGDAQPAEDLFWNNARECLRRFDALMGAA
jgi:hypothetical protein